MKLKSVSIERYRSIKSLHFGFPAGNLLVLVGPNNAGKSNIIRAIDSICGETWVGPDKMEDHDFYLRDRDQPFSITLNFDNGRKVKLSSSDKWPLYTEHGQKLWKRQIKEDFPCTYLGADRTFDKHMQFYDWTLIGKIRKRFHHQAAPLKPQLEAKFAELTDIFDKVEGFKGFKEDFGKYFQEMQADSPAKLDITFKPFTPANFFRNMQVLAVDPNQSDEALDLAELGEGSRNTVLLALLRSYAHNLRTSSDEDDEVSGMLALEEPEIFLHPQARRHLYGVLREIANSGIQVIISTHSASFVDTENFDSIGRVYKIPDPDEPGRTHTQLRLVSKADLVGRCTATGVPATKVTEANIGEFYRTTSNYRLNEAFFAKFVVLVEGETEELALPEYLSRAGVDCDLLGVSMIYVSGKNQIPKYWRLFTAFGDNLAVVFDSDASNENKKKSNKNLARCFGLDESEIEETKLFQLLSPTVPPATPILILQHDFETAIREDFEKQYPDCSVIIDDYETEARELIRPEGTQNKGQIARFVARRLGEDFPDYVPGFVAALADEIRRGLGYKSSSSS